MSDCIHSLTSNQLSKLSISLHPIILSCLIDCHHGLLGKGMLLAVLSLLSETSHLIGQHSALETAKKHDSWLEGSCFLGRCHALLLL